MSEQLDVSGPADHNAISFAWTGPDDDLQPQPGDVVMLFRLNEGTECSPIAAHHAILAVLREAGMIPYGKRDTPEWDAMSIRQFRERSGKLRKPIVRRYGRSGTWSR